MTLPVAEVNHFCYVYQEGIEHRRHLLLVHELKFSKVSIT